MADDYGAFPASGQRISISSNLPATHDQAGFEAVTGFTQIKDVTDIPQFGGTDEEIIHAPTDHRYKFKLKGGKDEGTVNLVAAVWSKSGVSDPGQDLVRTAYDSDSDFSFKVEYNDNPGGTSNTIRYFIGKVMGIPEGGSGSNVVSGLNIPVAISNKVVRVAAVA